MWEVSYQTIYIYIKSKNKKQKTKPKYIINQSKLRIFEKTNSGLELEQDTNKKRI